ncbi:histidine--tRNA ligase [Paenibacillus sp. AR247]|uniref:histidine--tRNA ligase n=1 Tax=Paenibacillus sp. AR247 TaxID=1631599 RepID=UPI00269E259C|nr:histidine--tRNA ligase [Paenibacillus sp. AR247]
MAYQKPTGTQDLLPGTVEKWQFVEEKARDLCRRFNYREIRTPMFEQTELFERGVGETTDIVEKEMYTFKDKGDRSMTLRPEGTAGVVRSYVENKLYGEPDVTKLYYIGPMFRYERPQAGRYRQFHQFGIEAFGALDPAIDAEVVSLGYQFCKDLGLQGVTVEINSVGNPASRAAYREKLLAFLTPMKDTLCKDCQSRMERNPMRVLDCKIDQDKFIDAPSILDSLDEECTTHFEQVKTYLTAMEVDFKVNHRLVRGLDYYTHTAFEYGLMVQNVKEMEFTDLTEAFSGVSHYGHDPFYVQHCGRHGFRLYRLPGGKAGPGQRPGGFACAVWHCRTVCGELRAACIPLRHKSRMWKRVKGDPYKCGGSFRFGVMDKDS